MGTKFFVTCPDDLLFMKAIDVIFFLQKKRVNQFQGANFKTVQQTDRHYPRTLTTEAIVRSVGTGHER